MKAYGTSDLSKRLKAAIKTSKVEAGFSLIELVVVVAVLAVLAAIAVPAYNNITEKGRTSAGKTALANALKECAASRADTGGTGSHTALVNGSGLTYSAGLTGTACSETTATVCVANSTNETYSANLATGVKTSGATSATSTTPCGTTTGLAW